MYEMQKEYLNSCVRFLRVGIRLVSEEIPVNIYLGSGQNIAS